MKRLFSYKPFGRHFLVALICTVLVTACAAEEATAPPRNATGDSAAPLRTAQEGRYSGPVIPLFPNCGMPTTGQLSIGQRAGRVSFGFDPFQSTAVIQGDVSPDGTLRGAMVRGPGQGLQFEAKSRPDQGRDTISGNLTSGQCSWRVSLRKN